MLLRYLRSSLFFIQLDMNFGTCLHIPWSNFRYNLFSMFKCVSHLSIIVLFFVNYLMWLQIRWRNMWLTRKMLTVKLNVHINRTVSRCHHCKGLWMANYFLLSTFSQHYKTLFGKLNMFYQMQSRLPNIFIKLFNLISN